MVNYLLTPYNALIRLYRIGTARPATSVWVVSLGVSALTLLVVAWQLGSTVVPAAFSAESKLADIKAIGVSQLLAEDSDAMARLAVTVEEVAEDLEEATNFMNLVGRFVPALSWMPPVRMEVAAWADHARRVDADLKVAISLVDASSDMLAIFNDAQSSIVSAGPYVLGDDVSSRIDALESSFAASMADVQDSISIRDSFSIAMQIPGVRGLSKTLDEIEDRMLNGSDLGVQVSSLLGDLVNVARDASPLLDQFAVDGTDAEPWTAETLQATLVSVNRNTTSAKSKIKGVIDRIRQVSDSDNLESQITTLDQLLGVLLAASEASLIVLEVVEPFTHSIDSATSGLLNGSSGLASIFNSFNQRSSEVASAVTNLKAAESTLVSIASENNQSAVAGKLSEMSAYVTELRKALQFIQGISPFGDDLLGIGGTKKYLVLGQSADEVRATGGFVSSIWLVTFNNGSLDDIRYFDAVRVDDFDRIDLYPTAPPGLEEHMNAWVWLMRDVSWDPDFPTTAQSASDIFRLGQRHDVDGVIALNQWTLLKLVEAMGEVPSPGGIEPITSRNMLSVLEQGTDVYGRAYMDLVLQGVLEQINKPRSIPSLMRIASSLNESLDQRDTLLFMNSPDLQSVFHEFGWDGSINNQTADYLYVVDSNVGWSKVDRNIQRDISYSVDLSRIDNPRATLTLGYNNHSGPGSPGCEPQWLNRGTNYSSLKNACYWNYFRAFIPQGSKVLSTTQLPLPSYSVSVEIDKGVPGENTVNISSSHDKLVLGGLTVIKAGDRVEIDLVYDLPSDVLRIDGDRLIYELTLQKQPGVRQRQVDAEFILPEGYRLESSSMTPRESGNSRAKFSFLLTRDTVLIMTLLKVANGPG